MQVTKRNRFRGFSVHLVRKFAQSILNCLDVLERNSLIHCDLKPENILLKQVLLTATYLPTETGARSLSPALSAAAYRYYTGLPRRIQELRK